jgi:hypothetical protein
MKNAVLTLFVMICGAYFSISRAQNTIGLKGGVNISRVTQFTGVYSSSDRLSGHAGIFVNHTINKNWHVQPEVLWSGQGQHHFDNAKEPLLTLDYLQIPVMFQYYPVSRLYFEAGPAVGILLSAKDKGTVNGHMDVKTSYTAAEITAAVGLGVKVSDDLSVYGRYNFGLNDITRFDTPEVHNKVAQIGIALSIH